MLQSAASGDDAASSSPEAKRALVQKEVARIETDVLPMLDKLGIS